MKSEQIKHSLSVGTKSIQSRVFDRETDEVISFVKIPIEDSGLVRCEKGTREMNNEPVAWRCKKFYETQEGWFYNENEIGEPLYTHPVKEQYKFGVDWSKDGNAVTVLKICEDGVAEVVFMDYQEATHPVKEQLTDEEIRSCWNWETDCQEWAIEFARAILRKAQEK